jgi:site-specific recombinase XerD
VDGRLFNYVSFSRTLPKLCEEAGVKRVTPHELRHSCTELFIQAGASVEDIRRLLNQKNLSSTARYIHRTDDRLQKFAAQVEKSEPVIFYEPSVSEGRLPTAGNPLT